METDYLVETVDLAAQIITFRKPPTVYQGKQVGDTVLLHQLGYLGAWSRLQPTSASGQVLSVLVRQLRME
jgi:hypothetical protein